MSAEGRLTVPAPLRRELGLEAGGEFEIDLRDHELVLKPVVVVPREDAWAYTPEHQELLRRALADSREGRVQSLSESDLKRMADCGRA